MLKETDLYPEHVLDFMEEQTAYMWKKDIEGIEYMHNDIFGFVLVRGEKLVVRSGILANQAIRSLGFENSRYKSEMVLRDGRVQHSFTVPGFDMDDDIRPARTLDTQYPPISGADI